MRGCEIRGLHWSDIDFLAETLVIRKGKTNASVRIIPLTPDAFEVLVQLRKRSELFGPVELSHYIFASFKPVGRFEGQKIVEHRMLSFDPTKPVGSWKKAWGKLTAKAGLTGLRFHDLRHHSITEMAESGASEQTIKRSPAMFHSACLIGTVIFAWKPSGMLLRPFRQAHRLLQRR